MRNTGKAKQETTTASTVDTEDYSAVPEAAGTKWLGEDAKKSAELVVPRVFSDTDLSEMDSWETAMSFVDAAFEGGVVNGADELGTGFRIADEDDKLKLCDATLVFVQWTFNPGDYGEDYVSINAIQRHDNGSISKWVINDGGTGLCAELKAYTKKTGRSGGMGFPKGLRVSKYFIDAETKTPLTKSEVAEWITAGRKAVPAHTFYLNTSA